MAARVASLAWMLAMSQRRIHDCPSLPGLSTLSRAAASCRDRGRRGPAVLRSYVMSALRPGLLGQDGVCLSRVHDLHHHVQRATVHAEGDCERRGLLCVHLLLGMLRAAAAPFCLMHREKAARGLANVDDAVCADSVLVHEPAEIDEEAMRVGLLQSRAVELLQALGGLLEAQAHATQLLLGRASSSSESSHPCNRPLIVTALRRSTSVTRTMCSLSRVMYAGDSRLFLPRVSARGALNGRGGQGSTRRLDDGELLVCERPVDGFSWSPPGRGLQADALRELVAVHDVVLQGAFPELLPAWPTGGRLRVPVWWPTQANRQGDRCPLGP